MKVGSAIRRIADYYGLKAQTLQTIEEAAELQKAICKFRRYGMTQEVRRELVDEIADTLIMCRQLEHLVGIEDVRQRIEYKLARQLDRMEKER